MRVAYRVYQGGLMVARVEADNEDDAAREAVHYAAMYLQDGPVNLVKRKPNGRWPRYSPDRIPESVKTDFQQGRPAKKSTPYDYYTFYRCYRHGWACYGTPCPSCGAIGGNDGREGPADRPARFKD